MDEVGQMNGMAGVGIKVHLSMERKYAQVQVQRGAQEPNQRTKTRKPRKRKSCENQGVTNLPLRINLVLEIWLLREPSQTYRPSETCCFSNFFFLRHTVPTVASNIYEGVYFTRSTVLTKYSLMIHHLLSC